MFPQLFHLEFPIPSSIMHTYFTKAPTVACLFCDRCAGSWEQFWTCSLHGFCLQNWFNQLRFVFTTDWANFIPSLKIPFKPPGRGGLLSPTWALYHGLVFCASFFTAVWLVCLMQVSAPTTFCSCEVIVSKHIGPASYSKQQDCLAPSSHFRGCSVP